MPHDDDHKVFDVSRPSRVAPNPTSRPIIVGQRPVGDDPMMVGNDPKPPAAPELVGHPVPVVSSTSSLESTSEGADHHSVNSLLSSEVPDIKPEPVNETPLPEHPPLPDEPAAAPEALAKDVIEPPITPIGRVESDSKHELDPARHFTPVTSLVDDNSKDEPAHHSPYIEEHHPAATVFSHNEDQADGSNLLGNAPFETPRGAGPHKPWGKIFGILLLVLVIVFAAGYVAIDDGIIKSSIKLPHHFFKQKTVAAPVAKTASTSTAPPATPAAPSVPAGFTTTKLTDATVSFSYPQAWGVPTETTDPGFSQRSTTAKSDGTHAYLVTFASNKDITLAFTSPKFLPRSRATQYYDYQQWCVGSADAKFYKQTLLFSTTSGTDTPTTLVCNQGPLADATKLDDTTIVQLKTKADDGTALGDLYTRNLTNQVVSVVRVRDNVMTNSVVVKQILATIQTIASSSTTTGLPTSVGQ